MENVRSKGLQKIKKVEIPERQKQNQRVSEVVKDALEIVGRTPRKDPWSRSSLEIQLRSARSGSKGLKASPVAPYIPLGTPDLKIHISSVPSKYKVYPTNISEDAENNYSDDISAEGNPLILPVKLKNCYWNGERWCGTRFQPTLASTSNGYELLSLEIGKSHARLRSCRRGKYFMSGMTISSEKGKKIQIDAESLKKISMKHQIPKLNLSAISDFEHKEQIAKNATLLSSFRSEAKRLASSRSFGSSSREHNYDLKSEDRKGSTNGSTIDRVYDGVPMKAIEEFNLFRLGKILDKETIFIATQQDLNQELLQVFKASDSLRPFTFVHGYHTLQNTRPAQECRPSISAKRAEKFRSNLAKHCWYASLIASMFHLGRQPSGPELMILYEIGRVIEKGSLFRGKEYCELLLFLQSQGVDLNEFKTRKALIWIRFTLQVSDEVLSEGFVKKCRVVPDWLSCIHVPKNYGRLSSRSHNCG